MEYQKTNFQGYQDPNNVSDFLIDFSSFRRYPHHPDNGGAKEGRDFHYLREYRKWGKHNMKQAELLENTAEQIEDAINILQLLMADLTANQDDTHIIRSVGIVEKMLQTALSNLHQIKVE